MLVALVTPINVGPRDGDNGQALDLLYLRGERMAIVGITGQSLHTDDQLAACGAC
jgi:hypothetical protein